MADKRFMNAGVLTAIIGVAILVAGVTIMIYPELQMDRHGEEEVVQPYFFEGSIVFVIGVVILIVGFTLYAFGCRAEPVDVYDRPRA